MGVALLAGSCLVLLIANGLLFVSLVPLRPGAVAEYLAQMAMAILLVPALVLLGMASLPRFREARYLLRGALAALAASLVVSAASVALSPPVHRLPEWDAAEKQAHLDQRCRSHCRNRGTSPSLCDELCGCTMEALFAGRSDEELQRLTAEGPYGTLSREANQLLGRFAAQCSDRQRAAQAAATGPAAP